MYSKPIIITLLFLMVQGNCFAQYFNGEIYLTRERTSTSFTSAMAYNYGIPESEFLLQSARATICDDTLIMITYGYDSLFKEVVVQIGELFYLGIDDVEFIHIEENPGLNAQQENRIKRKTKEKILGFDLISIEHSTPYASYYKLVGKNLKFDNSSKQNNNFRIFFDRDGMILRKNEITRMGEQELEINKIVFENCDCLKQLNNLSFFEKVNKEESFGIGDILGN